MNDYLYNLILGIFRVIVIFYLMFVLMPGKIFDNKKSNQLSDDFLANIILVGAFSIVLISLLIMANIYDAISLSLGILLSGGVVLFIKNNWRVSEIFFRFNSFMLKKLESSYKLALVNNLRVAKLKSRFYSASNKNCIGNVLLLILLLIASFLRLKPVFVTAAPFSMETYNTLEYVKQLQINNLFHDGTIVLKGLHSVLDLFFQFSRTDPEILVHIFGALSAVLLTYIIFYVVHRNTSNFVAGLIAASIFGIFSVVLPLNIQQQVEANSIMLGAVFAVASLVLLVNFLNNKNKKMAYAAIGGYIATLLSNTFFAAMLVMATIPMLMAYLVHNNRQLRAKKLYWVIVSLPFLLMGAYYGLSEFLAGKIILIESITSFFTENSFSRFVLQDYFFQTETYFYASIGIALLLLMAGLMNRKKSTGLFNTFLGTYLIILALIWHSEKFGLIQIFPKHQIAFLLSILLCISVGILIDFFLFQLLAKNIKMIYRSEKRKQVFALIIFVLVTEALLLTRTVAWADFSYVTEPNGYVEALQAIKNDYAAYQWTCVSHFGAKIQTKNYARYMDYLYFLKYFEPKTFNTTEKNSLPTPYLFIFMEKNKYVSHVATELLPNVKNLTMKLLDWCSEYKKYHDDMSVYYEDDTVIVYKILIKTKERINKIFAQIELTNGGNINPELFIARSIAI